MSLKESSSVLAIITHYGYDCWLAQSIESLRRQSRRPDAIVVLDDASAVPPTEIVEQFPDVTLLAAEQNAGPYLMMQAVFDDAGFDAFMLQDADDWSTEDRLEVSLRAAQKEGAEMVGCQEVSFYEGLEPEAPTQFPEDPLGAMLNEPLLHALSLPSSTIAKALIKRLGGLSTGLRYGADSEFMRRAFLAARVINVKQACYHRRIHPGAATRAAATGYGSALRAAIRVRVQDRARFNVAEVLAGRVPHLEPLDRKNVAVLHHLAGPRLAGVGR